MTIQLISSNSTKKRQGLSIVKYLPISRIVCTKGHLGVLRESEAMTINLHKKLADVAIFVSANPGNDTRRLFIPSVYVGIRSTDGIFIESALIGNAFPRIETSGEDYGIYLRYFVREQFVKFFAQTMACAGIKTLFFKDGRVSENAAIIFKENGIKVIRVDV